MTVMRICAGVLAVVCLALGFLMGRLYEREFGQTMFTAGAIIICGILISSAILEIKNKP